MQAKNIKSLLKLASSRSFISFFNFPFRIQVFHLLLLWLLFALFSHLFDFKLDERKRLLIFSISLASEYQEEEKEEETVAMHVLYT